ncbi:MAG: alpha/beta hydrolase [Pseudomonadota bacterium]
MPPSHKPAAHPRSRALPLLAGSAAFLAACALVVRHQTRKVEAEHPPKGRFVEVDGVRLHCLERGDPGAPALVMLHGNGATVDELLLSGLVARAAVRYRVIAFDRPGYGHSDPPRAGQREPAAQARLILRALQQMGVQRPLLFGHSWGTLVALEMALQAPQRVRALVLASGYYRPGPRLDVAWLGAPALPLLGRLLRHTVSPLLSRLLWRGFTWRQFSPREVTEPFRSQYPVWMSLRPRQLQASAAESALMVPAAWQLRSRYGELRMPLVLVGGQADRMVRTAWHSAFVLQAVPGSELRVVPGAGHMVHHVATHEVLKAIDQAAARSGEPHWPKRSASPMLKGAGGRAAPPPEAPPSPCNGRRPP